jgi:amino-acid N-acetyltransferase
MRIETLTSLDDIRTLLAQCNLPASDIADAAPPLFFGMQSEAIPVAMVGLELFQTGALLRSLAVSMAHRGRGHAQALVAHAQCVATSRGAENIYLLTTTAATFFESLGYAPISREDAPQDIRATAQFSGVCPRASALLSKHIAKQ